MYLQRALNKGSKTLIVYNIISDREINDFILDHKGCHIFQITFFGKRSIISKCKVKSIHYLPLLLLFRDVVHSFKLSAVCLRTSLVDSSEITLSMKGYMRSYRAQMLKEICRIMRKPTVWFPSRFDTNPAEQAQKMTRGWNVWI